jgi:hypothetical protein
VNPGIKLAFLLLVLTQTLHSFEEYYFSLWAVLAPARFISGLFSDDLAFGFAIINSAIVVFAYWTYLVPVSRNWTSASLFLWGWCLLELGNGIAHMVFAVQAQGYFPGLYTAPLLVLLSGYIIVKMRAHVTIAKNSP